MSTNGNGIKPLRLSKVGESCIYCGQPATVFEHVIPKRLGEFFDAGWNISPACRSCKEAKSDHIKPEHIKTPGREPFEDAAIWGTVIKLLDASMDDKQRIVELARRDLMKWGGFMGSEALGALEVFTGKHWCCIWDDCQERCATGGQFVGLIGTSVVTYAVPDGLKHLLNGRAIR